MYQEFENCKDAFQTPAREVTEIEALLPEIREKIADTRDMQEETFRKLHEKKSEIAAMSLGGEVEVAASSGSSDKGKTGKGCVPKGAAAAAPAEGEMTVVESMVGPIGLK